MVKDIIWVLSFTVLGSDPEFKELPKYKTKAECQQALVQYQEEYKTKNKKIAGSCHQTTKTG